MRVRFPDAQQLRLQHQSRLRVERTEGLVHQDQPGLIGERADHRDALAHPARELMRIRALEALEARPVPATPRPAARRAARPILRISSPVATFASTVRHGRRLSRWNTKPRFRSRAATERTSRPSASTHPADVRLVRTQQRGDRTEHGALAAAARADDRDELAAPHAEIDPAYRLDARSESDSKLA